jgi:hypothetical protein
MGIFEDFYTKERFIANRRQRKKSHAAYRLWRNRIIKFLEFCEQQHIFLITDIRQIHYDGFIAHLSKTRSSATLRDWKYALAYFFKRSHLPIRVQTSPRKQKAQTRHRAYLRLRNEFGEKLARKIVDRLDGLI